MVGRFKSVWFLHLLVTGSILAALPQNTQVQDPHRLIEEADRLAMLYNWPKAGPLYAEAERLFPQSGDKKNQLQARVGWIRAETNAGLSPALAREIEEDLKNPLVQGDSQLLLRCLIAKAAMEQELNEAAARPIWEKVLELAKGLGDKRWQARAGAELGIISFLNGDVATAMQLLKSSIISAYLSGDAATAIYYGSIVGNGMVEAGQPEGGLDSCDIALKTAATIKDIGFPFMAYEGKARALVALHREPEAEKLLDEALAQAKAQGARSAEAQLLIVKGKQVEASDPSRAIQYLKAASTLSQTAGFRHAFAWSEFELATVYRHEHNLAQAEGHVRLALAAMEEVEDKYHLPLHLALLAELQSMQGRLAEANRLYERAEDVTEGMLIHVLNRPMETSLIAAMSAIYRGHFALAARLGDARKSYEILESARGRSIADGLRRGVDRTTRQDWITSGAEQEVNRLQIALVHATSPADRKRLLERLFEAEQALAPTERPKTHLQRAALRSNLTNLLTVQQSLRPDETLLEYVLDQAKSFCLYVTKTEAAVTVLPEGQTQIARLIDRYLEEIRARKQSNDSARQLFSLLLKPIPRRALNLRLIVVPDGVLHLLPFDSLENDQGRRVIDSHIVTYAPSAAVLYLIRTSTPVHQPTLPFLGVGAVQYQQEPRATTGTITDAVTPNGGSDLFDLTGNPLPNLPMTRDEVAEASKIFGTNSVQLLGRDATEFAFKSEPLDRFKIIHIAAHGISSVKFPDRAALVLGQDLEKRDDGLLQSREIRNLPLNADLVTLSACDTGVGRLRGEEGISNLERAFLYAGTKSVLASLWTVSDIYSQTLMQHFYGHIAASEDKGAALRHAKLDLIREFGDRAIPFYWAGFVMVGDGSKSIPISQPLAPRNPIP